MIYIGNESHDPYFNLALEEYVLKHMADSEKYFLLWRNEPSVIVGRAQNTIEEVNAEYIESKKINVVRRISGGGAVYHDLGNLNYTFISASGESQTGDFAHFAAPVISYLRQLNVPAELTGRNDISAAGKKVSGNAQYYYHGKVLHHGTLLFNVELLELQNALHVSPDKIISKGIKSVSSRVANIIDYLPEKIPIEVFKDNLIKQIFNEHREPFREYSLTEQDLAEIKRLAVEKYSTWDWNYGLSPAFNIKKSKRFPAGKIEILLDVRRGIIEESKIYGDFLGYGDIAEIEKKLIGKRYCHEDLYVMLNDIEINQYFGDISKEEIMGLLF